MDPERWRKVDELFHEASALQGDARSRFLDQACAGDPSLHAELDALLRADDAPSASLGASAGEAFSSLLADEPAAPLAGRRIGAYELIEEIGAGGMGAVWLARRADAEYEKRVAIKLLRPGRDSEGMVRRFLQERQTLATLDHPNIVRMLDGGTTADGLVYFVTEHIEGQRIDAYCDAHNLSTSRRLQLFLAVCSAVQYAHQRLIVHRDLKPSNILATADGVPKLLDFGIAKLLHGETAERETMASLSRSAETGYASKADSVQVPTLPTQPGSRPMTPYYASPEQVRGEQVTTASDVYSLGVVLYELLTGHGPYRLPTWTSSEIERAVCEEEPLIPSAAVDLIEDVPATQGDGTVALTPASVSRTREGNPSSLRRRLTGDLDAILVKALQKNPGKRYHSMEEFSQDIQRYLQGFPVLARTQTLSYRAGKFILSNRAGVIAATLLILSLLGGVAGVVRQARIAAKERDVAIEARAAAEDQRGIAEENLIRAQTAERGAQAAKVEAETEARTAKEVSEFLVSIFSSSYPGTKNPSEVTVRQVLDWGAFRIPIALRNEPLVQATLMDVIGRVYVALGLYEIAAPLLENALATRCRVLGEEHPEIAASLHSLGSLLQAQGKYQEAESIIRECVTMRRKVLGEDHPDTAVSLNNLVGLLKTRGDYANAEPLFREAIGILKKIHGDEHPVVATMVSNLAVLLLDKGDWSEAESLMTEVLSMRRKLLGETHADVAASMDNLAGVLKARGDYTRAEPLFREAIAILKKIDGDEHPRVAAMLNNLAQLLVVKGDLVEAEALHSEVLAMRRKLLGEAHPDVAVSMHNLAGVLKAEGDYARAEPLYREAIKLFRKAHGNEHPEFAKMLDNLAELLLIEGNYPEAEALYRDALNMRRKLLGDEHPDTATDLEGLAFVLENKGDLEQAEEYCRNAIALRRKRGEHLDLSSSLTHLALILEKGGNESEAEQSYRDALTMARKFLGDDHLQVAASHTNLARVLHRRSKFTEGEEHYREALKVRRKLLGNEHVDVAANMTSLGQLLRDMRKLSEAQALLSEAISMRRKLLGDEHVDVAISLASLASVLQAKGDYREAERLYREELSIHRKLSGAEHVDVAHALNNLARVLSESGNITDAEASCRGALAMRRKLLPSEHIDIVASLYNLAWLLSEKGDYADAQCLYREALSTARKLMGDDHPTVASIETMLALSLDEAGQHDEAEALCRRALESERAKVPNGHASIAGTLLVLGITLVKTDRAAEAEPMLREVLDILSKNPPDRTWKSANAQSVLGGCLVKLGRHEEAEPLLIHSHATIEAELGNQHRRTGAALQRIVELYEAWEKPEKAAQYRAILPQLPKTPEPRNQQSRAPSGGLGVLAFAAAEVRFVNNPSYPHLASGRDLPVRQKIGKPDIDATLIAAKAIVPFPSDFVRDITTSHRLPALWTRNVNRQFPKFGFAQSLFLPAGHAIDRHEAPAHALNEHLRFAVTTGHRLSGETDRI